MNTAHICLVRHGETDWNKDGILQGWLDGPINDQGRQQARELAASLATAGYTAIWTSALARARETADIIASALELPPPLCHPDLKERNFGATKATAKHHSPSHRDVALTRTAPHVKLLLSHYETHHA